jgi:hypothetical protein
VILATGWAARPGYSGCCHQVADGRLAIRREPFVLPLSTGQRADPSHVEKRNLQTFDVTAD